MMFIVVLYSFFVVSVDDHRSTINIIFLHLVIFFIDTIFLKIPETTKNIISSSNDDFLSIIFLDSIKSFCNKRKYYQTFFYKIITCTSSLSQ